MKMWVTEQHMQQFRTKGFFLLESVMTDSQLQGLRQAADELRAEADAGAAARETISTRLSKRNRYFLEGRYREKQAMYDFVHSDLLRDVCTSVLGDNVYLFVEQFVVKGPGGRELGWHQDSGYVPYPHPRWLSCWCTLDDVCEENGSLYVLPFDRLPSSEIVKHEFDEEGIDEIADFGDDPGDPVTAPAGSVLVFPSTLPHRSVPNRTSGFRRCYLAQFSGEPIMSKDGTKVRNLADPIVLGGKPVRPEKAA
jgi:ectoine hydroxylase-related dioxygenase (phytanoyl-CoA dioxygenase family)